MLRDEVRLAGQLRLVDLEPALDEAPVDDELIARLDGEEVADDELLGVHLADLPGTHDLRRRPRQQGDAVERLLGANLLDDADDDVRADDGQRDERVEGSTHEHEGDAEDEEHVVDEREDVLRDDGSIASRRGWWR